LILARGSADFPRLGADQPRQNTFGYNKYANQLAQLLLLRVSRLNPALTVQRNEEWPDARLEHTPNDDDLEGTDGADFAAASNGDDTIKGGDGDDFLNGGNGDDVLEGEDDNDTLIGGEGDDTLKGGGGDDVLIDSEIGSDESGDDIEAEDGDDVVAISPGAGYTAVANGGDGVDELVINDPHAHVDIEEDDNGTIKGTVTGGPSSDPYLIEFEDFESITLVDLTPTQFQALCFGEGTMIDTPDGPSAVETRKTGDLVTTLDGKAVPVRWLARQTIMAGFGPAERLMPVRIAAGALGAGLPNADLTVTADHGMLVDGVICHAGALVNGTTITRVPLAEMGDRYTVYHIDTEAHEIVLANGAAAETFIDNAGRMAFDNYAEFAAKYGDVAEMEELDYPRAMSARQVPARIRAMLAPRKSA
jgi:Ca2+-binding RTX toxin-like protein